MLARLPEDMHLSIFLHFDNYLPLISLAFTCKRLLEVLTKNDIHKSLSSNLPKNLSATPTKFKFSMPVKSLNKNQYFSGKMLATRPDGHINIYSTKNLNQIEHLKIPTVYTEPYSEFSPYGNKIISKANNFIYISDLKTNSYKSITHLSTVKTFSCSQDEKYIVCTIRSDFDYDMVCVSDSDTAKIIHRFNHTHVMDAKISPNNKLIVSIAPEQSVIWDMASGTVLHRINKILKFNDDDNRYVLFSPDSELLAIRNNGDSSIDVYQTSNGECLYQFKTDRESINDFCFAPNGKMIACCTDNKIKIFDLQDAGQNQSREMSANDSKILLLQFSKDSRFLLSTNSDHTAKLINVDGLKVVLSLENVGSAILSNENALIYTEVDKNIVHKLEFPPYRFSQQSLLFSRALPQQEEINEKPGTCCQIF